MERLTEVLVPARLGPGFRRLLASSWTSNLGDGVAAAAGPLLVASLDASPSVVALAATLRWTPPLLFGLGAGVLSDRLDRRRLAVAANCARLAVLAGLVAALATGTATVPLVLGALALVATAEVFADSAARTLTPMLVRREDLSLANARLTTGFITLDQLAGPPIGAALFAAGRVWPFVGEAVLLTAAIALLARVVVPRVRPGGEEPDGGPHGGPESGPDGAAPPGSASDGRRSVRRDVAEGFVWTWRHPAVRTLALTILVFNVTFGAAWAVLVLYAHERLGLGAVGFGILSTVSAAGGLLGTSLYGWITRHVSLADVMRIGLVLETLTHLGLALTRSAAVAGTILFVFGAHAFVWGTTSTAVRQAAVPLRLQGRVDSVYTLAVYGGLVAGSAVGGALGERFGVTAPFWFAFGGSAVFLVLLWRELARIALRSAPELPTG
ncbi:MFS transporter [Kineosporia sp. R_H_3]|uniref:MFS transporter n=1 Tax=Kineosporia sp. R_H_3 TaxID=1961848 RepID=UPI000B4BB769|nr:MFS transporter [Kineosporia sp. R_H_3]